MKMDTDNKLKVVSETTEQLNLPLFDAAESSVNEGNKRKLSEDHQDDREDKHRKKKKKVIIDMCIFVL